MRKQPRANPARTAFRKIRFEPLEARHLLSASVYLSELVAWGGSDLVDADGESPDWIEIANAGDETADLTGWALTDDASDPDKWVFPSVSLDPDERLVVFASGKDRTDPRDELHTSFALDADGEYLALVDAGGTIISEFEDGFPEQKSGLSYGCEPVTIETDLLEGAALVYQIPTLANSGDAWTEADFDATSWTAGDSPLGYDQADPGTTEATHFFSLDSVANADTLAVSTQDSAGTGYGGDANDKFLTGPLPAGGLLDTPDGSTFQLASYEGANTLLLDLDDEAILDVDDANYSRIAVLHTGVSFHTSDTNGTATFLYADGSQESQEWDVADCYGTNSQGDSVDAVTGLTLQRFSTGFPYLNRQWWSQTFEIDPARTLTRIIFDTHDVIDGQGDDAQFGVYAVTGYREPTYDALLATDLEAAMAGANSSVRARWTFDVDSTATGDDLVLKIQYDDGFVAMLDGVEIARRNAPEGTPAWNATATASRTREECLATETIVIAGGAGLLSDGENVLAIQGLNDSASDETFFLSAGLSLVSVESGDWTYTDVPTPGEPNVEGLAGWLHLPLFDVQRGFYDDPFSLSLGTWQEGAVVRYTLDGSEPSATNGVDYIAPLTIPHTTTVRAAVFADDYWPSESTTQTYIFAKDTLTQPATRDGYAQPVMQSRGGGTLMVPLDFEVDPEIVDDPAYHDDYLQGLLEIPTISLVLDVDDLFDSDGFYPNGGSNENGEFERPVSVEIIDPNHLESNVQANAGIQPHSHPLVKRSMQLQFKDEYGDDHIETDLFKNVAWWGEDAATVIDRIVLRAGYNRSFCNWSNPDDSAYIRDEFARATRDAMSGTGSAAPGALVHVYINGMYWGLYDAVQRPDEEFSAVYSDTDPDDWYARNHGAYLSGGETLSGDSTRFDYLVGPLKDKNMAVAANYAELQEYLDVESFADYLLLNWFGGNGDWPYNNYYCGNLNGDEPGPLYWYDWDCESFLDENDCSGPFNAPGGRGGDGAWVHPEFLPGASTTTDSALLWHAAVANDDFMTMFADRAFLHTSEGGALSTEAARALWMQLAGTIENAIVGESARWGDVREEADGVVRTRDNAWATDVARVYDMLEGNDEQLIAALRAVGYYPDFDPPVFDATSGAVTPGDSVTLTPPPSGAGQTIEVALLPSTPSGFVFVPDSQDYPAEWAGVDYDPQGNATYAWTTGDAGFGYERTSGYESRIETDLESAMFGVTTSALIRIPFTYSGAEIESLTLGMEYDDGFVAYLNGVEIARSTNVESAVPGQASLEIGNHEASTTPEEFDVSAFADLLVPGENVLAIHGINVSTESSDFLIVPHLGYSSTSGDGIPVYYTTDGSDPRLPGGGISAEAHLYDGGIVISENTTIRARALQGNQWSAINETRYFTDLPAEAGTLAVTELNYHPYDPTEAEIAAGFSDDEAFEFLELQNIATHSIDLAGVALVDGVTFAFPEAGAAVLAPGECVLLVHDLEAFAARYGSEATARVVGEFEGSLSNGGERLELAAADGTTIVTFSYSDDSPWPEAADGDGPTLELIDTAADPSLAASWRASVDDGGTPGTIPPARTPGDLNGDGMVGSADLDIVRAHWGADVEAGLWGEGDPSGDGIVGSADLDIVRAHWGEEMPVAAATGGRRFEYGGRY